VILENIASAAFASRCCYPLLVASHISRHRKCCITVIPILTLLLFVWQDYLLLFFFQSTTHIIPVPRVVFFSFYLFGFFKKTLFSPFISIGRVKNLGTGSVTLIFYIVLVFFLFLLLWLYSTGLVTALPILQQAAATRGSTGSLIIFPLGTVTVYYHSCTQLLLLLLVILLCCWLCKALRRVLYGLLA
jgi:hypothetical protein